MNVGDRTTGRRARRVVAAAFAGVAGALAVASFAFACTVAAGSTWYSDGTRTKSGPVGTQIRAFATGAIQNVPYHLVLGNDGNDPGHASHACMNTVDILNPTIVNAAANGRIATVTGIVHSTTAKATYQLCFKDSSVNNSTGTGGATFTVI